MSEQPRVPDWWLERLAAGELPERVARELRERLDRAGEAARLDTLDVSNAEILRMHPAALVAAEVERRAAAQGRARPVAARPVWPVLALGGSVALALMLVRVLDVQPRRERANGSEPSARLEQSGGGAPSEGSTELLIAKGLEPYLSIYRRTGASPERLAARARVRAGDTLQLAYVAAGQRFGVVASVDGRGAVTLHLPETSGRAAALDNRGETALPHAFELDATPGNERFVFVTSPAPFDTGTVVAHLEGSAPRLPAGLSLRSIELEKSTP